jgi:hypothetical protein
MRGGGSDAVVCVRDGGYGGSGWSAGGLQESWSEGNGWGMNG